MNRTQFAYWGVVLVACLSVFLYARHQTNSLAQANRDSCKNYETLRAAVNEFHTTVRMFLERAKKARQIEEDNKSTPLKLRQADKITVAVYNGLIQNTHIVSATCAQKHQVVKKEK